MCDEHRAVSPALSDSQIDSLARGIAGIADRIMAYYDDPKNEQAFQEWYLRKYGHPAPEGA